MDGRLARWAPVSGIVFVVLWIVAVALAADEPDSGDSDGKILAYYAKHSNRVQHWVAFFLVAVALFFFLWFLSVVRSRLAAVEGGPGRLTSVATTAGVVFVTILTLGAVTQFSFVATISDTSRFHADANTIRLLQDLAYIFFVLSLFAAAAFVWATSILGWRAGALPRWLAGLGSFVGATCFVGFTAVPGAIFGVWLLLLSGYLTWRQLRPEPVAAV
jgi:hypothetical protein